MLVARLPGLGRHRAGLVACVILSVLAVMAVLAPWIAPRDPLAQSRADRFLPPSLTYPFDNDFEPEIRAVLGPGRGGEDDGR
jgi:peptide/nickel transport system permease protein